MHFCCGQACKQPEHAWTVFQVSSQSAEFALSHYLSLPNVVYATLPVSLCRVICLEFCDFHSYKSHFIQSFLFACRVCFCFSFSFCSTIFSFFCLVSVSISIYLLLLLFLLLLSAVRLCFFSHSFAAVSSPLLIFMYGYFRICFIGHVHDCLDAACAWPCSRSPHCAQPNAGKLLSLPVYCNVLFICLLFACTTIWFMLLHLLFSLSLSLTLFACF